MGLRAGDDDPLDVGDQPRLLEHVDDERLAAEQQELLWERPPDALADPPGEHDHPDLHAVLRVRARPARAGESTARTVGPVAPAIIPDDSDPTGPPRETSAQGARCTAAPASRRSRSRRSAGSASSSSSRPLAPGRPIDAGGLLLRLVGGRAASVPVDRRRRLDGDRLRLRFNVMQGRASSRSSRRWRLMAADARGSRPAVAGPHRRPGRGRPGRDAARLPARSRACSRSRPAWRRGDRDVRARRVGRRDRSGCSDRALGRTAPGCAPTRGRPPGARAGRGLPSPAPRPRGLIGVAAGRRILFTSDSLAGLVRQPQGRPRPDGRARARPRVHDLQTLFRESSTERRGCVDRLRLATAPGRGRRHPHRRLTRRSSTGSASTRRPDHPAVARGRGVQDRRLQPGRQAGRRRTRSRASTRTTPHAIVSSEHDVPFYAEAFGIPEAASSRPGSRGWTGSSTRRPSGGARRGARGLPRDRGPDDDPVRADVPRRRAHGPRTTTSTSSTTPRSTRSPSRRMRWSSSRCTRS